MVISWSEKLTFANLEIPRFCHDRKFLIMLGAKFVDERFLVFALLQHEARRCQSRASCDTKTAKINTRESSLRLSVASRAGQLLSVPSPGQVGPYTVRWYRFPIDNLESGEHVT